MKTLLAIALTVAPFGSVTFTTASELTKRNVRATRKEADSIAMKKERNIDVINKIQLEDQAFWERTLSMSQLGDESYACAPPGECDPGYCTC